MLRKIGKEDQDRICSQQVITELKDSVKELVDNSIDARCTEIFLSLTDNGASTIELIDNGTGIEDLDLIGERNSTSKLVDFDNINLSLETLGFRGEGLNSIINSCETVEIHTLFTSSKSGTSSSGEGETKVLTFQKCKLVNFDSDGNVKYNFQGKTGTRIKITGLFVPYVSRRKHFLRNIKQQLKSLIVMLEEYAICYPEIRFFITNRILSDSEREKISTKLADVNINQQNFQQKNELLITRGGSTQKDVAKYLWGKSVLDNSLELNLSGQVFVPNINNTEEDKIGGNWSINGFVSSLNKGRPYPDHQLFTVNRRPIDPIKRISRSIFSVYSNLSSFTNKKLYPVFVINITLPPPLLDINVTPNKRTIMLPSVVENVLLENIQQFLLNSYKNSIPICNRPENLSDNVINEVTNNKKRQLLDVPNDEIKKVRNDFNSDTALNNKNPEFSDSHVCNSNNTGNDVELSTEIQKGLNNDMIENNEFVQTKGKIVEYRSDSSDLTNNSKQNDNRIKIKLDFNIPTPCILEYKYSVPHQEEIWKKIGESKLVKNFVNENLSAVDFLINNDITNSININENNNLNSQKDSIKSFNFEKELFNDLDIIGQFNKGFILTKLAVLESKLLHIFIIDQHASDEKARFESLNKDFSHLQTQQLISPLSIRLTPSQEQSVLNYRDIFENNGFRFVFNNSLDLGSRVQLTHLPVIFGIPLKQLDFLDLLSQIGKHKTNTSLEDEISPIPNVPDSSAEDSHDEREDSITVSNENNAKDTVLWCPLNTIPRPKKIWSILASK
ncbi:DNA mismatch repair [Cryptosporidium xiaoi]|uniref:DNA mismatch repair n=1 Tax=Cryptosporidium xiaoi TaxID=659607 RepID=A0AAV9XVA4_9CRYT